MSRTQDRFVALERARWLSELAQVIAQAQKVAWSLGVIDGDDEEARQLYGRLEAVRSEVESLRFGGWARSGIDAEWLKSCVTDDPPFVGP